MSNIFKLQLTATEYNANTHCDLKAVLTKFLDTLVVLAANLELLFLFNSDFRTNWKTLPLSL